MEVAEYIPLEIELQQVISTSQAWHYQIVPKFSSVEKIEFYTSQDLIEALKEELEILFGKSVQLHIESNDIIQNTISRYYRRNSNGQSKRGAEISNKNADNFLFKIIHEAKELGASDIHVEIFEELRRIRMRVDGKLIERYTISKQDYPAFINKIKINANLDIAEKRLPQDGRILFKDGAVQFDIRVSILPSIHGEKAVLRLLNNDAANIELSELGFTDQQLEDYKLGIQKPSGIVLLSGPTGSGKTTTLYATLKLLNDVETNILTVEDPVEYTLEGINQVHVKESIGLTFASALKSFLRQDPDIIMLGEIRDKETAQMAIRAALTGHLVLSTIHTNSAWGTVSRLLDMGLPAFLIANTLNTSIAQRLIRLLCSACKKEADFNEEVLPKGYKPNEKLKKHYQAVGCATCYHTGYKGRKALYQVIPIDGELSQCIKEQHFEVKSLLEERNIQELSTIAYSLFAQGETSLEEIYPHLIAV